HAAVARGGSVPGADPGHRRPRLGAAAPGLPLRLPRPGRVAGPAQLPPPSLPRPLTRRPDVTSLSLQPRVVPRFPGAFGTRRSGHVVERNLTAYRRMWLLLFTGVFEPIFYLLSLGVGLGKL